MFKHITLLFSLLAAVAFTFAADTAPSSRPTTKPATTKAAKRKVIIGHIAPSNTNNVFVAQKNGAAYAASVLGDRYNVEIEFIDRTPPEEDPKRQAEALDQLVRDGAHGVIVTPSWEELLAKSVDKAVDRGTVVVCVARDIPKSKRLCFYGTDDYTTGKVLGRELAVVMKDKGTIAILGGNQAAPNLQARIKGVKEVLANSNIKILDTVYHHETIEKSAEAMIDFQKQHPEITGWALIGGWPLYQPKAFPWQPGSLHIVAIDAHPAQLSYVKDGHVDALLAQDCYGYGFRGVQLLLEKIVNNKNPDSEIITDPTTLITKKNVEEYAKDWDKWLKRN